MTLKLDKNNIWSINTPNMINLFTEMMKSETNKKYLTLNQCSKILYSINQSIVLWGNDEYIKFINSLNESTMMFYTTNNLTTKGQKTIITRENIQTVKNDFDYLLILFSSILPLMILNKKHKLMVMK
jgi:hypothetical protein